MVNGEWFVDEFCVGSSACMFDCLRFSTRGRETHDKE